MRRDRRRKQAAPLRFRPFLWILPGKERPCPPESADITKIEGLELKSKAQKQTNLFLEQTETALFHSFFREGPAA
jgi:hypothetical protein